ncbi:MAG: hypothetical protein HY000_34790 [Planctomycetes bacterium]|nr:hypothetical protein [Planctomycetota bacterium]
MRFAVSPLGGLLLATACLGCGRRTAGTERFVPPVEAARQALSAALKSWQNGEAPGAIPETSPPVQLVDSHRKPGQKLASFEILGEVAGDGPRTFAVKARLEDPQEEQRVRFVLVGRDPIWVFREEDYEMMVHWEHPMPATSKEGQTESTTNAPKSD